MTPLCDQLAKENRQKKIHLNLRSKECSDRKKNQIENLTCTVVPVMSRSTELLDNLLYTTLYSFVHSTVTDSPPSLASL